MSDRELDGLVSVSFDADDFDALRAALVGEGEIDDAAECQRILDAFEAADDDPDAA